MVARQQLLTMKSTIEKLTVKMAVVNVAIKKKYKPGEGRVLLSWQPCGRPVSEPLTPPTPN